MKFSIVFVLLAAVLLASAASSLVSAQSTCTSCPGLNSPNQCCNNVTEDCHQTYHFGLCCPKAQSFCSAGQYSINGGACYDASSTLCCSAGNNWVTCDKNSQQCCTDSTGMPACCPVAVTQPLEPTCFGKTASDPTVCSSAGRCTQNDVCSCNCGRAGDRCEIAICFGKISYDPNVCSGHGGCPLPDTCVCQSGWTGRNCEL